MGHKTFERGIHPAYYKELTAAKRVECAALPKTVTIPLQQHAGAPCEPLVKKGDLVHEGQKIGDVKAFVSAPVHASISGKVKDIELAQHPGGIRVLSVIIEGDGAIKDWEAGAGKPDLSSFTSEGIREAIREAGIVGMGGAAFPTSVKLAPPKGKTIEAVILNGCECEPYLTADHRIMAEEPEKVVWGLKALMKAVGAPKGFVGIEENKPEAIKAIKESLNGVPEIRIIVLEAKYPQGAEKMLIYAALGRKVPSGKLPLDVGVIVNNVGTAAAVYEALACKKPLIERIVTISGNGVKEPRNLKVRIGTSFEEVLSQCGGITADGGEIEVLNGGPMMGIAQSTLNVPVVKGTSGITVISSGSIKSAPYEPCIKCARCVEACPMALMPYKLGDYGRAHRLPEFKDWQGVSCIECGCCSYVCPSKRPLLQWIRIGKLKVRQEAAKSVTK
ncbi:MAG: electron transport complex subunit RsxC [Deltaproteobacteria bacterium]|nr:electron transport complex subunit RsxC [Deltaproteobacteria bacterium]